MIKQTQKIVALATICMQLSAALFAGSLEDAVLKFGGGSNVALAAGKVLANKGKLPGTAAYKIANGLKTPEAFAIGGFVAKDNKPLFKSAISQAAIEELLQDMVGSRQAPVMVEPSAPAMKAVASGIVGPDGNAVSQDQFNAVIEELARLVQVVESQKIIDAAVASQGNEMLQSVIASSKDMAEACLGVVDVMFEQIRQAIAAMDDAAVANQVIARVKQNASSLSAVSNKAKAHTLGRMSSKKNKKARA